MRFHTYKNKQLHLQIEVEDSGPGISEEDLKRLFKPFVQLAEDGEQKGTGLGLTITRQFVELMKGSITVDSTLGKGTLFRVELPIEAAERADIALPEPTEHVEIVGLAPGLPRYRILIAEDQLENQLLLGKLMANIGLDVKVAGNGEQCVGIFQDWGPDLIWMDLRMPVMDGAEATRRIRQLPGGDKVKIVAVTASVFKEGQQEMLAAGMDDFVHKPYRFDEIYDCLAQQLDVKYIYKSDTEKESGDVELTPVMLTGLPPELRQELRDALTSLESEQIAEILQKISTVDAELGRTLSRLVEFFDYPAILDALDGAKAHIKPHWMHGLI